jgi:hypothetical protein
VDLGEIRAGTVVHPAFVVINDDPAPAQCVGAVASCGCLKPTAEPAVLQPGQKGKIFLHINTLGQASGPHGWSARVRFQGAQGENEVVVGVQARVVTEVSVQPASLTLISDKAMTQDLTLADLRPEPLTITEVKTSSSNLKAHVMAQGRDGAGHWSATIRLEAGPGFSLGRHDESLAIYTRDPLYSLLQVPVTVIRGAAQTVQAVPAEAALTGSIPSQLIRLRSSSSEPLRIDKVEADDPALVCRWAAGSDGQATVRVVVGTSTPRSASVVRVYLSSPRQEVLTIPVRYESD